jgi:hypothetical protein
MAPFSMQCKSCREYIYKGKKFNANKETVDGENYYSIKIFRFYIRCPKCHAEITFKTDPANLDYVAETGAVRNFEPWRDNEVVDEQTKVQRALDEEINPIKALENKTIDSKREMETLDLLDEMRMRNDRLEGVNVDEVLEQLIAESPGIADDDEELDRIAKEVFANNKISKTPQQSAIIASCITDSDNEDEPVTQKMAASNSDSSSKLLLNKRAGDWSTLLTKKHKVDAIPGNSNLVITPNLKLKKPMLASYNSDSD